MYKRQVRDREGEVVLGPDSVGYRLTSEALAFGGSVLTATDVALRMGGATIDGVAPPETDRVVGARAWEAIRELLEETIDRMKPSVAPVPVILVGGGSIVAPEELSGVSELIRPEHFGTANAVGAALGDVAGQSEKVATGVDRRAAREEVAADAVHRACLAGADPSTVEVTSIEELPMAYSDAHSVQIRATAVGRLA